MAGMFSTAKTLAAKPTAKAKKEKLQIEVPGLADLAKLDALIKAATAMKATLETDIKTFGFDQFMEMAGGTRPSSFEGTDGVATASVELRKRGTNSALNEEEAAVLERFGIEPFKQVVTNGLFAINPKYAEDASLLGKVEKALAKIVPEDFIVQQQEVSKLVVSDEMLDGAFRAGKPAEVLALMTTMALKPKLSEAYSMEQLMDDARDIMFPKAKKVALPAKKAA
jgi:hypothetical protein